MRRHVKVIWTANPFDGNLLILGQETSRRPPDDGQDGAPAAAVRSP
jgi:hypothetical protein